MNKWNDNSTDSDNENGVRPWCGRHVQRIIINPEIYIFLPTYPETICRTLF